MLSGCAYSIRLVVSSLLPLHCHLFDAMVTLTVSTFVSVRRLGYSFLQLLDYQWQYLYHKWWWSYLCWVWTISDRMLRLLKAWLYHQRSLTDQARNLCIYRHIRLSCSDLGSCAYFCSQSDRVNCRCKTYPL